MENSIGIVAGNAMVLNNTLCVLPPQLVGMHWHAIRMKQCFQL